MALTSPGVEVTIIDQSQYLPAPSGSIPFVLLATAQNKANPNGTGVAVGTTAANANKLSLVTSQRDLVTLYGTPFFYTTTNGTPIQGYELNEYGLLAAYSVLGATSRAYVLRADIDLASLVGQTGRPTAGADNGTYWLDSVNSNWGIYEWNATTQVFTQKIPKVITEATYLQAGIPVSTYGNIGDYAVVASAIDEYPSNGSTKQYFYKSLNNTWVPLGSDEWAMSWPTVQATVSNPTLISGNFTITLNAPISAIATITITSGQNIYDVANAINDLGWTNLSASVVSGKLNIFASQQNVSSNTLSIELASGTGGLLAAMGVSDQPYYQPIITYGTASQMPLWKSSQTYPRPSGSVWIKVGASGNGLNEVISEYNSTTGTWRTQTITYGSSMSSINATLDPTGGKAIPAKTLATMYNTSYSNYGTSPLLNFTRLATGVTTAVGTVQAPTFPEGTLTVYVSQPNSGSLLGPYYVPIAGSADLADFVTSWSAVNIPYTQASITTSNTLALTHLLGGDIYVSDYILGAQFTGYVGTLPSTATNVLTVTSVQFGLIGTGDITFAGQSGPLSILTQESGQENGIGTYTVDDTVSVGSRTIYQFPANYGTSSGILLAAGMVPNVTASVKDYYTQAIPFLVGPSSTTASNGDPGTGSGAKLVLTSKFGYISLTSIAAAGASYVEGDTITFDGSLFGGVDGINDITFEVTNVSTGGITGLTYISGNPPSYNFAVVTNWDYLDYVANEGAPVNIPANDTNWYYSAVNQVDIMVNTATGWKGYLNVEYDENGFPTTGTIYDTDPNGPIISASEPTTQSDGTALVYGDLWVDTSDLENYPLLSRWQNVDGKDKWVLIDTTDQVSSTGIVFADARWGTNGAINPENDPIPTIQDLLGSDYLDLDAPSTSLYPVGMLLWNTRRSGYNVKQFKTNYFTSQKYPNANPFDPLDPTNVDNLPLYEYTWVSASGLQANGAAYMGRKAQRAMVVKSLKKAIDTNTDIRDADNAFNLIACPNYPELQPNMVVLNNDRGDTGYILGDTPLGLPANGTDIQAWATNAVGATSTGEDGCVTRDTYMGLFYPSGLTNDLNGNLVAVPPSHMMLRTFIRNDTIAYPWLAAAGTRRGVIDNATNIGYLDRATGEFVTIKTNLGIRDTLYVNFINPLVFFTGNGLLNYGNKTSFDSGSALDRTNVARLCAYIRRQLTVAARPFVFEPNDSITRQQISGVVESLMIDLVAKRGIYDYLVVCNESNNTPERIDRNELWVDVAIEPVKAAEFIYIPVRVLNTGELQGA